MDIELMYKSCQKEVEPLVGKASQFPLHTAVFNSHCNRLVFACPKHIRTHHNLQFWPREGVVPPDAPNESGARLPSSISRRMAAA